MTKDIAESIPGLVRETLVVVIGDDTFPAAYDYRGLSRDGEHQWLGIGMAEYESVPEWELGFTQEGDRQERRVHLLEGYACNVVSHALLTSSPRLKPGDSSGAGLTDHHGRQPVPCRFVPPRKRSRTQSPDVLGFWFATHREREDVPRSVEVGIALEAAHDASELRLAFAVLLRDFDFDGFDPEWD